MEKLLIIGASGLTGFRLAQLAKDKFQTFGTYNSRAISIDNCTFFQLDKTDKTKTSNLIKKINPGVIIDCSALHNVDYCEINQEESWNVNTEATKNIAATCKGIDARMIFISTDYVFDGTAKSYTEDSPTNPLNYYGVCKLKAEEEIAKIGISYAIGRTSLVFGWNPGEILGKKSSSGKTMNYVIWAVNKLKDEESLKIVTDQFSTPTYADSLAEMLLSLAISHNTGIFHTTGKECLNRFDFTIKIAEIFGLNKELITPVTSDMFKQVAKRPMRCCMDTSKIERVFNIKPLTINKALTIMREQDSQSL